MKLTHTEAVEMVIGRLRQRGAPEADAVTEAQALVATELKGLPSHGRRRRSRVLARIERGRADARTLGICEGRAPAVLDLDGRRGLGLAVAAEALLRLPATGVAVAAIHNRNPLGLLAAYTEEMAAWGCVGRAMSSSQARVHPHGGTRAVLGANPIAISGPTAGRPLARRERACLSNTEFERAAL